MKKLLIVTSKGYEHICVSTGTQIFQHFFPTLMSPELMFTKTPRLL